MAVQNGQDKTIIMMPVVVCSFQVRITMAIFLFIIFVSSSHCVCFVLTTGMIGVTKSSILNEMTGEICSNVYVFVNLKPLGA